MKKSQLLLSLTTLISAAFMVVFLTVGFLAIGINTELPSASSIKNIELKIPLRIYTSEGLLISEFGTERRKPIDIDQIPQTLINAVLSAEDASFFEHQGIDLKGIIRATLRNLKSKSSRRHGASTITMQVARNFYLTPEQTYTRKIKEIFLAIKLEQVLSKDEILSLYLNKIFLGHRSYGFGAAADVYYGKSLNDLSIAEIAMLAGLPKAPSSYNPISNPKRATTRRNHIINRLLELKYINDEQHALAFSAPVTAEKHSLQSDFSAPHIAEMVRAKLVKEYGPDVYWQGFNVTTTIRKKNQQAAEKALRKGLQAYDRRHGFRGPIAHIDLNKLESDETQKELTPQEKYAQLLAQHPNSQEQIPALIVSTSTNLARAATRNHGTVDLTLKHSSWAKKHRTQNIVGPKPSAMDKLLKIGDIVYIKPLISSDTKAPQNTSSTAETSTNAWQLSQIPDVSGSILSIDPNTGELLSLIGGYDFFINKYNRATQSIRQPGSNIKPFIYSASIDKGFTPASLISGAPIVIRDPNHGTLWRPENYSGKFFGPTRMRVALAKSMNLVSIRLLRSIGIPFTRDYITRFGIDMNRFSSSLSMALGSGGVIPIDMLGAYGALANGGYKVNIHVIETITDRDGIVIYQAPKPELCDDCYQDYLTVNTDESIDESLSNEIETTDKPAIKDTARDTSIIENTYKAPRVMSQTNNFLTVSMLKDVVTRGTARKALALKRNDLAGKTGTTNDYVDAWFSGFNSQVATTVWVGFDKPKSMGRGEAGGVAALPIWVDYMSTALNGIPEDTTELPDYIEQGWVNRVSGQRTSEDDPSAMIEYFAINQPLPETPALTDEADELSSNIDTQLEPTENDALIEEELETDNLDKDIQTQPRIIDNPEDTQGLF